VSELSSTKRDTDPMNESPISNAIEQIVPPNVSPLAKKLRKKGLVPGPVHDDPRAELRRLVREHTHTTRLAVSFENSAKDRTNKTTREHMPCQMTDFRTSLYVPDAPVSEPSGAYFGPALRISRLPVRGSQALPQ